MRALGLTCWEMLLRCSCRIGETSGMTQTSSDNQQSVFSRWLRTGRLPPGSIPDGVELKFNPWHDPTDGRFTFAGSGHYHGPGGAAPSYRAPGHGGREHLHKPQVAGSKARTLRAGQPTRFGKEVGGRGTIEARSKPTAAPRGGDQPSPVTEFVGGVGEGCTLSRKERSRRRIRC